MLRAEHRRLTDLAVAHHRPEPAPWPEREAANSTTPRPSWDAQRARCSRSARRATVARRAQQNGHAPHFAWPRARSQRLSPSAKHAIDHPEVLPPIDSGGPGQFAWPDSRRHAAGGSILLPFEPSLTAGPVRPANRSREAGREADDRVSARPPSPPGRWRFRVRGPVIATDRRPRRGRVPASIVDPRVGDLGPALLALEDGTVFPGIAFGAPVAAGGDLVVNTSQTGYQEVCTDPSYAGQIVVMTYPLIGNYGRADRRRPVAPAVAPGARRRERDRGRPRRRAPARRAPARLGDPGDRRRRHPGPRPPPPDPRRPPGDRDRARASSIATTPSIARGPCPRWEDQDFVGQVSPASIMDVGSHDRGRPADRDRRLRAEVEHRPRHAPARRAGPDPAPHDLDVRRPRRRHRRADPVAGSRRSGPARRPGRARPGDHRRRPAAARDLPRPPDRGPRRRRRDDPPPVRPPRREPSRSATSTSGSSRSPPRTTRSRWSASRCRAASGFHVSQVNLNDGSVEGLRHATLPIETVQYHPEGAPGPLDALAVFDRFVAAAGEPVTSVRRGSPPVARDATGRRSGLRRELAVAANRRSTARTRPRPRDTDGADPGATGRPAQAGSRS